MNRRRSSWTDSFRHAFGGFGYTFRQERHMRFHVAAAVAVTAAGLWFRLGRADWLWLGAAITGVWTTELMNTAVERAVDLLSPERHPLAKAAKDAAAAAVLIAAMFAAVVGVFIFWPPLWRYLSG